MELKPEATRNMTAKAGGGLPSLKSPIPYFFGGLAIVLTLISVALLILTCSHRMHSSSSSSSSLPSYSSSSSSSSSQDQTMDVSGEVNSEPKIAVVMAGDTNPTFLAKPLCLASALHAQQSL